MKVIIRVINNVFKDLGIFGQKKGAMIEIAARINPISYEKPYYKRYNLNFSL